MTFRPEELAAIERAYPRSKLADPMPFVISTIHNPSIGAKPQ
jgi:hypothetical protein